MYDEIDLCQKLSKKRKKFITSFLLSMSLLFVGIALFVLSKNKTLSFFGIVAIILSLLLMFGLWNRFSPTVLFSRAVKGRNIKEHIYEVYVRRGIGLSPRQAGTRYGGHPISHIRMAKGHLRSAVYLRLENGNIFEIRGLRVEHVELYKDGDELYKYAGTKYPIIIGRTTERQPCPLCGAINTENIGACINCGLKIRSKKG